MEAKIEAVNDPGRIDPRERTKDGGLSLRGAFAGKTRAEAVEKANARASAIAAAEHKNQAALFDQIANIARRLGVGGDLPFTGRWLTESEFCGLTGQGEERFPVAVFEDGDGEILVTPAGNVLGTCSFTGRYHLGPTWEAYLDGRSVQCPVNHADTGDVG